MPAAPDPAPPDPRPPDDEAPRRRRHSAMTIASGLVLAALLAWTAYIMIAQPWAGP